MASGEGAAKLFIYSIVGFFVGLWFFYKGFKKLKLKRTIENMPTSNIRSLAIGLVEIYAAVLPYQELLKSKITNFGQTISKEILKSPFSQKECLYYKYTVERYVRSRKSSYWVMVTQGTAGKNPFIKEGTAAFNEEGIMIQKGNNPTYYISDKDEKAVLSSIGWSVFGGVIGGAVLALAFLTYLLFFIGLF